MNEKIRNPDRAIPEGWDRNLNRHCDLDQAFLELEGWDHFHTDTTRGRLRTLQLRPMEGWQYFRRAEDRYAAFPRTNKNKHRYFYLKVYCFENARHEESEPGQGDPALTECYLNALLDCETPGSESAEKVKRFYHGLYFLHKEEYAQACELFSRLIGEGLDKLGDSMCGVYFAAAVAFHELGDEWQADRQLENGFLCIPTLQNKYNMGLYAGVASALLRIWGRDREARDWDQFLDIIKIPKKTADLFRERERRIRERSASLERVFLF